jgi:Spy/CpxP family protein refolding chaperone
MITFTRQPASRLALLGGLLLFGALLAWPLLGAVQHKLPSDDRHQHIGAKDADKDLAGQIRNLQAKVAKLEAALQQGHQAAAPDKGGMKMGKGKMGMGMMDGMQMGGMGKDGIGKGGMGMMDMDRMEMMGMMGMAPKGAGSMSGMKAKMQMQAALPGFPGASHIYHIGATDFFLDHADHITLTSKQKAALGHVKEKTLLTKATAQRKIEETEQELWELTASDRPDVEKIEAKVREIEKLRGDQRLAFIRSVGMAAKVLTDEQRQSLLGTDAGKPDNPDPHAGHKH